MRVKTLFCIGMFFVSFAFLPGCTRVRTYTVVKERPDQELSTSAGNMGYFGGAPKETDINRERKTTRMTYVTEVELGSAPKKKPRAVRQQRTVAAVVPESTASDIIEEGVEPSSMKSVTSYTVENNDTLQKISIKVYGTSKRWKKIFDANADQLKSPDRIYAGQVLKIPQE